MRLFIVEILVPLILLYSASICAADMYKYTDAAGTVCMTNSLQSVPKKYRSSMTTVKEDVPLQKPLLSPVQRAGSDPLPYGAPQAAVQESKAADVDVRDKYVRTGFITAGIIAGYFVLTRLMGALGFPRVGTILFLALTLSGGIYLYGLYINEMKGIFAGLHKDATKIKQNVETRENKTDQMLKKSPEAD